MARRLVSQKNRYDTFWFPGRLSHGVNRSINFKESPVATAVEPFLSLLFCSKMIPLRILSLLVTLCASSIHGFAPVAPDFRSRQLTRPSAPFVSTAYAPASLQRQRKSVAAVQTMGLFGLGAPEIAIILVAAAFLLGPQKLAELGKDAGKIAGELKEVPKEFQKGLAEGEELAKANKSTDVASLDAAKDADTE